MSTNIILSGSSGILGSQILYELIHENIVNGLKRTIYLIIRPGRKFTALEKLKKIFENDFLPKYLEIYKSELFNHIELISKDVREITKDCFPKDIGRCILIHAASSVNLGQKKKTEHEVSNNNYLGTQNILKVTDQFTDKVVFISTAFSSGHREGIIDNDFLSLSNLDFRNPYEKYKNQTEQFIAEYGLKNKKEWQILRPSVICGRLFDAPLYYIPRFLVFYGISKFFFTLKGRMKGQKSFRIPVPEKSHLNIIPVDYCAKAILRAMKTDLKQLNIVNDSEVNMQQLFSSGFKLLDFENYEFCENHFQNRSILELIYHKTIDAQLGPYMFTPHHHFETQQLNQIMQDYPHKNIIDHFKKLIGFATLHQYRDFH